MRALFLAAAAFVSQACVIVPPVPAAAVRAGTAQIPVTKRIAVFAPTCKGATQACSSAFVSGMYGRVVSELELDGFTVVPGDELLATARERTTLDAGLNAAGVGATASAPGGESAGAGLLAVAAQASVEKGGAGYRDLTPPQRRELLAQARVDGVLWLTVLVGEDTMTAPWYDVHLFEATGRLAIGEDDVPAWTSRCATPAESAPSLGGIGRSFAQAGDELGSCLIKQALR